MLVDLVADVGEPHRVQFVEHGRRAVGIPPVAGEAAEVRGFVGQDACVGHAPLVTGPRLQAQEEIARFMPRIVMKFGGTSMAGIERIRSVATRVKREAEAGNEVLVVVSAMAGETDRLIQLCREAAALHDADLTAAGRVSRR